MRREHTHADSESRNERGSRRRPIVRALLLCCLYLAALLSGRADAQVRESAAARDARMRWWREARFGIFIHWGLYAIPARGEWVMYNEKIPAAEYEKLAPKFKPAAFDGLAWARIAREAGARYIVITSKHHDGFCLWPSAHTRYDVADATPFTQDVLRELADGCEKEGIRFGVYHSIMDWHHPDANGAAFPRYRDGTMIPQLKEIVDRYNPAVLWFDGEWIGEWSEEQGRALYAQLRAWKPDIIVNNRVGKGRLGMAGVDGEAGGAGDFGTPEQQVPASRLDGLDWETCMTMNGHWGYAAADTQWKSTRELIRTLADVVSKGGNFLLNVGPDELGQIPKPSVQRLEQIGKWMHANGESIYGTTYSPFHDTPWGRCTMKRLTDGTTRLYLHVFQWPADGVLHVPGLGSAPARAYMLAEKFRGLRADHHGDTVSLSVPLVPQDAFLPVLVLEYIGDPVVLVPPRIEAPADIFIDQLIVTLGQAPKGAEYRISVSDSSGAGEWRVYQGPLRLTRSAVVRARCWFRGSAVGPVIERRFERHQPRPADKTASLLPGLAWRYAEGQWSAAPSLDTVAVSASGTAREVSLTDRKRDEHFAMDFRGYVRVPADGVYRFTLDSDDGSVLEVGGATVVDNDGFHGIRLRSGSVALRRGVHRIRIRYFNGTADRELRLSLRDGSGKKLDLRPLLFHTADLR